MLLVIFMTCLGTCLAELSHVYLKGIDRLVDHPGASPILGFVALNSYLPNWRFLGNYGDPNRGYFCGSEAIKIAEALRKRKDCPFDWNSEWLQRLFPSHLGIHLTSNQVKSDPVSRLDPATIGAMLQRVAKATDDELSDPQSFSGLINDVTDISYEGLNFIGFAKNRIKEARASAHAKGIPFPKLRKQQKLRDSMTVEAVSERRLQRAQREPDKYDSELNPIRPETREERARRLFKQQQRLTAFEDDQADVRGTLFELAVLARSIQDKRNPDSGTRDVFCEIASLFVNAVKESRGFLPITYDFRYPRYFPEQALLAYLIRVTNKKSDLVPFLLAMPELVKDTTFLSSASEQEAFSVDRWERGSNSQSRREEAIHEYMKWVQVALFLPQRVYGATAEHTADHLKVAYSDCGENSIRNFLNVIFYNQSTRRYDVAIMDFLEKRSETKSREYPKLSFDEALRDFYKVHGDVEDQFGALTSEWAWTVVSRRPGVQYGRPGTCGTNQFEIVDPESPANMFGLGQLLFAHGPNREMWNQASLEKQVEILNFLLSRDDFNLDCTVEDRSEPEPAIVLVCKINDKDAFEWVFQDHSFYITYVYEPDPFPAYEKRRDIFNSHDEELLAITPLLSEHIPHSSVMPLEAAYFDIYPVTAVNCLLASSKATGYAAKSSLMANMLVDIPGIVPLVTPFAKRLVTLLSARRNQRNIQDWLHDAHWPLGIPYNLREEVSGFRSVSMAELESRFGSDIAERIPHSWAIKLLGVEVILTTSDYEKGDCRDHVSWEKARDCCLALNPEARQAEINHLWSIRESDMELARDGAIDSTRDLLYDTKPIGVFHLITIEQAKELMNNRYTTSVLRHPRTIRWIGSHYSVRFFNNEVKVSHGTNQFHCVYNP